MYATLPVSISSAERSFSTLRRLKTWLRSTMIEERLNGLALLHTHTDIDVKGENIIEKFATQGNHRLELFFKLDI